MKVIAYDGEDCYILKDEQGAFYLVNLEAPSGFLKRDHIDSFLKFGGSWKEVEDVKENVLDQLLSRIPK